MENILQLLFGGSQAQQTPQKSALEMLLLSQENPGAMEQFARYIHDGRDLARRRFFNETRAGLWNSATAPEQGSTYGGLGLGLDTRRRLQMGEAQGIADDIRGNFR